DETSIGNDARDPRVEGAQARGQIMRRVETKLSFLSLAALLLASGAARAESASPDAVARVLAGLETTGVADEPGEEKRIAEFAKSASSKWARYIKAIGAPMTKWAASELPHTEGETIFYPF